MLAIHPAMPPKTIHPIILMIMTSFIFVILITLS
jgi:hypothetical protein